MDTSKQVIGVEQILQQLKEGMTREDIGKHYGLTKSEVKLIFMDSRLKGKKTVKKPTFILVDDTTLVENKEVKDIEVVDSAQVTLEEAIKEAEEELSLGEAEQLESQDSVPVPPSDVAQDDIEVDEVEEEEDAVEDEDNEDVVMASWD